MARWHDGTHDVWPWTEYYLGVLLAAYDEFEQRVDRVATIPGTKTAMVERAIEGFIGGFTLAEVERACPVVSRDMIRHVFGRLRKEGRIEAVGRGKAAKWRKIDDDLQG